MRSAEEQGTRIKEGKEGDQRSEIGKCCQRLKRGEEERSGLEKKNR